MLLTNPAAVAHAPKCRPLASAASRAWDAQRLRAFLDSAADYRLHAALWLSANTGMRRGEILGLRWGDVDLDGGRLSVSRSLVSVGYEVHEIRGKTRTARRTIDLDPRTVEVLRAWRSRRGLESSAFDPGDAEAYVFARPDGTPIHPHLLSDAFKKLVKRSGLPRIRLHDLRHTHATLLLKSGVPIKVVSERLGHATPGFTIRHLPARTSGHAGRSRPNIRGTAGITIRGASTGFYPVEVPVEDVPAQSGPGRATE